MNKFYTHQYNNITLKRYRQAEENARDEEKEGSRTLLPIDGHLITGRQRSHDDQASVRWVSVAWITMMLE